MSCYLAACVAYTVYHKMWLGLFFMCLFTVGYFYVTILTFHGQYLASRSIALVPADQPQESVGPARRELQHSAVDQG